MDLKQLVTEARSKDEDFNKKMTYWLETKQKAPDLKWLMRQLEQVLGRKYCQDAAKAFLEDTNGQSEQASKEGQESKETKSK